MPKNFQAKGFAGVKPISRDFLIYIHLIGVSLVRKNYFIAMTICFFAIVLFLIINHFSGEYVFVHRVQDHLTVHLTMEMVSVTVSVMIVLMAFLTLSKHNDRNANVLVFGFSLVAGFDYLHAITYKGMPSLIVDGSTEKAVFFWLGGRFSELLSVIWYFSGKNFFKSRFFSLISAFAIIVSAFLIDTYYLKNLPVMYVEGVGVTGLKIVTEYFLCLGNLLAAGWLYKESFRSKDPDQLWSGTACFVAGIGELAFTNYIFVSETQNVFGHLFKVIAYVLIFRAIFYSALKRPFEMLEISEEKLRARQAELEFLLSNIPAGVAQFNSNFCYLYANQLHVSAIGANQTVIGKSIFQFFPREAIAQVLPRISAALKGDRQEFYFDYFSSTGVRRTVFAIFMPESFKENIDSVFALFVDKTKSEAESRKLVASLKEISELKSALDAHAIVAITDANGVITKVNEKFCEISKFQREELVGSTHRIINSGAHDDNFFREMWGVISLGGIWNGEICNRAKDGGLYWVYTTIVPFVDDSGVPQQYIAIRADITLRKKAEEEAKKMAFHDFLTGLPNRRLMYKILQESLVNTIKDCSYSLLFFLDLDHFKEVNDTLGHDFGDELLRNVATQVRAIIPISGALARLGGDEFVVIINKIGGAIEDAMVNATHWSDDINKAISCAGFVKGKKIRVTSSIGAVLFKDNSFNIDELIKQADIALYKAKENGRNQICFFDPSLQAEVVYRSSLIRDLHAAESNEELYLNYQPIVQGDGKILGVEALLRWNCVNRGSVSPAIFIPLAEQSDLIVSLGAWVLRKACQQLNKWKDDPIKSNWTIAVNVSARQFCDKNFTILVMKIIAETNADPYKLRLELTESMLNKEIETTISKMELLKKSGIRFSLDDFGTGYSSLSYLKKLPFDVLKIDRSFVLELPKNSDDVAIAKTIKTLADSLSMRVIAEGVEDVEQVEFLEEIGCNSFQGYYFCRPVEVDSLPLHIGN